MRIALPALLSLGCAGLVAACSSAEPTAVPPTDKGADASVDGAIVDDGAVTCDACFPIEALPEGQRALAEKALLAALDGEALYSVLSDIKPMSSGFAGLTFPAASDTSADLEDLRAVLRAFQCTPRLSGGVQVFAQASGGEKSADAILFHHPRFAGTIEAHQDPFAALGITAAMPALEAVERLDRDPTTKRFRAYGYFFGYPKHAVDFFVMAEESEAATGKFVERDFVHIPTFAKPTGAFTYAVPKGHVPTAEDLALRDKAAPVLAAYKKARAEHVAGGAGAALLVRAVFDDGRGRCKPENAAAYVAKHGGAAVCARGGEACAKNADCCSGDCHEDHCH